MATILIINDSDSQRSNLRRILDGEKLFDRVLEGSNGFVGLRRLLREPVDVVLCDLELPGLDGEKLLRVKGASPGGRDIPFLVLTASEDLDRHARLLDGGAVDAIAKPFHAADLVARLKLHLKIKRLQDELMEKNDALARMSSTDALTGLRTRRYVSELLSVEFLRAQRYGHPLSLVMADLDHFKEVNDRYGHPGGDAALRGVGELLLDHVRKTDVAGRYGGEELIVVMPNNLVEGAVTMAERWRASVEAARFKVPDGRQAQLTVSVGIAGFESELDTPEDLIALADEALYRAKANGRNCVECG